MQPTNFGIAVLALLALRATWGDYRTARRIGAIVLARFSVS